MNNIELYNVNKVIDNNIILNDVNLKFEKGKIYGLVGENGSGKSTLLKIILNLNTYKGKVFIKNLESTKNFRIVMQDVGGIVDYVSFYEYLSGYENLRYFSLLYNSSITRIYDVMNVVGLDVWNQKIVKNYSLGMKQRLGIAIALLKNPEILLLDEPTNGLDPKGIYELRKLLLSFKDKTIIISSHLISEIEKICDEVVFINNRKVYQKEIKKSDKVKIKFELNNYNKTILNYLSLNEVAEGYCDNKKVSKCVKELTNNNISIYRIYEKDTLEDLLINLIEGGNDGKSS